MWWYSDCFCFYMVCGVLKFFYGVRGEKVVELGVVYCDKGRRFYSRERGLIFRLGVI